MTKTYKNRFLEQAVLTAAKNFKVVLVVGPRQVGKSTLLQNLFPDLTMITFDQYFDEYNVRTNPDTFLRHTPGPLILDEVQRVLV